MTDPQENENLLTDLTEDEDIFEDQGAESEEEIVTEQNREIPEPEAQDDSIPASSIVITSDDEEVELVPNDYVDPNAPPARETERHEDGTVTYTYPQNEDDGEDYFAVTSEDGNDFQVVDDEEVNDLLK